MMVVKQRAAAEMLVEVERYRHERRLVDKASSVFPLGFAEPHHRHPFRLAVSSVAGCEIHLLLLGHV
jgi:hypothetical protein